MLDPNVTKIFRKTFPNITFNGVAAADDPTMFTKLKAGGGEQYDIVFCNCGWTPTYHKAGLTEPIDLKVDDHFEFYTTAPRDGIEAAIFNPAFQAC